VPIAAPPRNPPPDCLETKKQHLPVFEDLVANKSPQYIAGGATQNTARVAQWQASARRCRERSYLLSRECSHVNCHMPCQVNTAGAVTYAGSIGKDAFGQKVYSPSAHPSRRRPAPSLLSTCSQLRHDGTGVVLSSRTRLLPTA
jgi:hypothetical protein